MQIEHDPEEPPKDRTGNGVYWAVSAVVLVLLAIYFLTREPDWQSLILGFGTGQIFVIVMTAITGNKVPKWMR